MACNTLSMRRQIIYSLIPAAAAVAGHVYLAPGRTPPDGGLAAPDEALLTYFEPDYVQSRAAFRRLCGPLTAGYRDVECGAIPVPSRGDENLTVDWVHIPAQAHARRLLILTSGKNKPIEKRPRVTITFGLMA